MTDDERLAEIRTGMRGRTQYEGREERTDEFLLRLLDEAIALWSAEARELSEELARMVARASAVRRDFPEGEASDSIADLAERAESAAMVLAGKSFRYCRRCGCSEHDACDPPCSWVEADLCSACGQAGSS